MKWSPTVNTISDASTLSNSLGELARIEAVIAQNWNAVTNNCCGMLVFGYSLALGYSVWL